VTCWLEHLYNLIEPWLVHKAWSLGPWPNPLTSLCGPLNLQLGDGNARGMWRSLGNYYVWFSLMGGGERDTVFIGTWCKIRQMRNRLCGWPTLPNFLRVIIQWTRSAWTWRCSNQETFVICCEAYMGGFWSSAMWVTNSCCLTIR
jgi:hypothetical protein